MDKYYMPKYLSKKTFDWIAEISFEVNLQFFFAKYDNSIGNNNFKYYFIIWSNLLYLKGW